MSSTRSLLLLILLLCSGRHALGNGAARPTHWPVMIGSFAFAHLELALTESEQVHGLMHRQSLPDDGGMIFVFANDKVRAFWMKNTLIELDILYLDKDGRVVSIHTMKPEKPQQPEENDLAYELRLPSYYSQAPARFAIELKGGQAQMAGCKVGDLIEIGARELIQMQKTASTR